MLRVYVDFLSCHCGYLNIFVRAWNRVVCLVPIDFHKHRTLIHSEIIKSRLYFTDKLLFTFVSEIRHD